MSRQAQQSKWPGLVPALCQSASCLALPAFCAISTFSPKWRSSLTERLGGADWNRSIAGKCIWLHGASVGEVAGLVPVLGKLEQSYGSYTKLVTTTSSTGKAKAASLASVDAARIFPFDNSWLHQKRIDQLDCRLAIISETEIWPNFLFTLHQRQIPALLINARISDYTFANYYRLRKIIGPALSTLSRILCQTKLDAERFSLLGVSSNLIEVVGSTKYDRQPEIIEEDSLEKFASELGIDRQHLCFVAGSVRPGEDVEVINAYLAVKQKHPELQMIIAPRHPERFADTAKLLQEMGLPFTKRSENDSQRKSVLLLDTMGELSRCYALASFAFIGGTLVDIGGHNPFEPAAFRKPVILGPHVATIRDAVQSLRAAGAVFEVNNGNELAEAMTTLSSQPELRIGCGESAYRAWRSNLGATDRVMAQVGCYLDGPVDQSIGISHSAQF